MSRGQIVKYYSHAQRQSEQDGWGLLYGYIVLEKEQGEAIPYLTEKNKSVADLISFKELMRKENDEFGLLICGIYTEEKLYLSSDTVEFTLPEEVLEDMDKKFAFEYMVYPRDLKDNVL
jgi:hypothetical protein